MRNPNRDPDLLIKPDSLWTQLGLVGVTLIVVLVTILTIQFGD